MKLLALKWSSLALLSLTLCGCFGGTIAQQLARSILIQGADKATANAIEAQERYDIQTSKRTPLKDNVSDDYQIAFLGLGFKPIEAQIEPLPQTPIAVEEPIQIIQETKLVNVEVWNLLIGDEKLRTLEKASLQGSTIVPPKTEWSEWQIAVGAPENAASDNEHGAITFLIPPDIGKMHSGAKAMVELSSANELSIARYALN